MSVALASGGASAPHRVVQFSPVKMWRQASPAVCSPSKVGWVAETHPHEGTTFAARRIGLVGDPMLLEHNCYAGASAPHIQAPTLLLCMKCFGGCNASTTLRWVVSIHCPLHFRRPNSGPPADDGPVVDLEGGKPFIWLQGCRRARGHACVSARGARGGGGGGGGATDRTSLNFTLLD